MELVEAALIFVVAAAGATGASAVGGDRLRDIPAVFARSRRPILGVATGMTIGYELTRTLPASPLPSDLEVVVLIAIGAFLIVKLVRLRKRRLKSEQVLSDRTEPE